MEILNDLYTLKSMLLKDVFPDFQYIASSIAGITATMLIVSIALTSYIKGEGIDWLSALRPFVIAFVLSVYPSLIIVPLDSVNKGINKWMDSMLKESKLTQQNLKKQIKDNLHKQEETLYIIDPTEITDPDYSTKDEVDNLFENNQRDNNPQNDFSQTAPSGGPNWFIRAINWLVQILTYVAQIFILVLSSIYLMLLSLTGPITFALAILPAFRSGIASWFARYIQISLWIPLAQIFSFMINHISNSLLQAQLTGSSTVTYPNISMLCISLVSIIGIFKIPSIAEWVVESTGGKAVNHAVNRTGAAIPKLILKAFKK